MESDSYLTLKAFSQGLYKEKGSKFIGLVYPVSTQEEIKDILDKIGKQYHNARHHCFAWVLGLDKQNFRVNDNGEPSGTAGKPILGQISAFGLTNVLIVVIRYFGGKLLGVSGLINAYRSAAKSAINNGEIVERFIQDFYKISFPYTVLNEVMKIIKDEEINQSGQKFELECSISISFRRSNGARILERFSRIEGLKYKLIANE
jgi:uncharacterized YigZ family protein